MQHLLLHCTSEKQKEKTTKKKLLNDGTESEDEQWLKPPNGSVEQCCSYFYKEMHHHSRIWRGEKKKAKDKKMCPIFIEWMMELMHGVTFETSRVTKSDSFPSVDWLQSDRHGKYPTHHRSAAKQINEEPPAHMADRLTQLKIIKNTVLLKSMPSV